MPKVIQMRRRTQPENPGQPIHRSMILAEPTEESESLSKIQRWLDMGDAGLHYSPEYKKETA
jgi:hypothetical protein